MERRLLTIQDVSRELGLHPMTVYRFAQEAVLPGFKVGGRWRFKREFLDQWMAERVKLTRVDQEKRRKAA